MKSKMTLETDKAKLELSMQAKGPGPMTIVGPCVVDFDIKNGLYQAVGIRYGNDKDKETSEQKFHDGDIIRWNNILFLVEGVENLSYKTISLHTGSAFLMNINYAHEHVTYEA